MCPNSGTLLFTGEKSTQSGNLTWKVLLQLAQLHSATGGRILLEESRTSHQPRFPRLLSLVLFFFSSSRRVVRATARDPPLQSTKGEGGVCGGQRASRLPQGREVLARQAFQRDTLNVPDTKR